MKYEIHISTDIDHDAVIDTMRAAVEYLANTFDVGWGPVEISAFGPDELGGGCFAEEIVKPWVKS